MRARRSALIGFILLGAMMAVAQVPTVVQVGTLFPYTGAGSEWQGKRTNKR